MPTADLAVGRVRAWVWVACGNGGCASFGQQRQVYLRRVALGVVELPHRLLCEGCGFDLGYSIWEAEVPKIHVGREPTHRDQIPQAAAELLPAELPVDLSGEGSPLPLVSDEERGHSGTGEEMQEISAKPARKTAPRKKAN